MIYNPLQREFKNILGAVRFGDKLKIRVKGHFDSVIFVCHKDGENDTFIPMICNGDYFEVEPSLNIGLYFYAFKVNNDRYISCGNCLDGYISNNIEYYQLSIFDKEFETPYCFKGGIIYQIFPDRFAICGGVNKINKNKILHSNLSDIPYYKPNEQGKVTNNDFFGGNIRGIIKNLDYLIKISVSAIYLNPIFEAYSNHRYDTGDYSKIDSLFGTEDELKELIVKAGNLGIKIILDGVFNHTGDDSIYFNKYNNYSSCGAFNDKKSPYRNWFIFDNSIDGYKSWWGISTLPATNKDEKSPYVEYITNKGGILEKYIKMGVGGFRLDVVDELPSHFVKKIRSAIKRINNDAILIGEVWEDASNKVSYDVRREYFLGGELDSVMNYPLKNAIINFVKSSDSSELVNVILNQLDHYPKIVLDSTMNILASHDSHRLLSALGDIDVSSFDKDKQRQIKLEDLALKTAKNRLKIATAIQYTIYGVPSVYYGDEIGMQGYDDPLNRQFFEWNNIDYEIHDWYVKLGNIRSNYSCFVNGSFDLIYNCGGKLIYKRVNDENEVMVAINISNDVLSFSLDGELYDLITEKKYENIVCIESGTIGIFIAR